MLAGCAYPRDAEALDALAAAGVRAIVNLAEDPHDGDALRELGIECVHVPVPDFSAPDEETLDRALRAIAAFRAQGRPVAVNCGAGYGRTGTLVAAYLVAEGMGPDEAIAHVRRLRPGSVETAEQEAAVHAYAARRS